jgi:hypothetical protein
LLALAFCYLLRPSCRSTTLLLAAHSPLIRGFAGLLIALGVGVVSSMLVRLANPDEIRH